MVTILAIAVTFIMSLVGVVGDFFINLAGEGKQIIWRYFFIGFIVYALTAFGWLFVMRHLKLVTLGVIYTLTVTVSMTLVGYFLFNETLNRFEVLGIGLAGAALVLMMRFA